MTWLGDLIAGVLKGIGALIGELRKSKEVVALLRLVAAIVISGGVAYYATLSSGAGRFEALAAAVGGAVLVVLTSGTAARLGITLPRWLAERAVGMLPQGDEEWEIRDPSAVLGAYPTGLYVRGRDVLILRPKVPVQQLVVECYKSPVVVRAFVDPELRQRFWVTKVPGGGVERLNLPRPARAFTFSTEDEKWAHLVIVRAIGVDISTAIFKSSRVVFVTPPPLSQ
jgi:hypothetical protein